MNHEKEARLASMAGDAVAKALARRVTTNALPEDTGLSAAVFEATEALLRALERELQ